MKTSLYYHLGRAAIYFSALFTFTSPRDKGVSVFTLIWSLEWIIFRQSNDTERAILTTSFCCWWGLDCSALVNNLKNHLTPRHTKLKLIATLSKKKFNSSTIGTHGMMPAQLCWENCSANLMILGSHLSQSLFYYTLLRGQEICGFNFNKAGFVFNGAVSRKQN